MRVDEIVCCTAHVFFLTRRSIHGFGNAALGNARIALIGKKKTTQSTLFISITVLVSAYLPIQRRFFHKDIHGIKKYFVIVSERSHRVHHGALQLSTLS